MGKVYLVGAGPGDPGLITRRGETLIRQADCVIYDRLVNPQFLTWTRSSCQQVYVGKKSYEGGRSQSQINKLLVEKARQHRLVVRLKGGDPTLFGRISEELEALVKAKIPFEVVPGVSSAWAAPALAGIPLTDRRFSSSVAVVTGQGAAGEKDPVRWKALAKAVDTLVILMGRSNLPKIARVLEKAGKPSSTPAALIRWAGTPQQEVLVTALGKLESELKQNPSFGPPIVVVIGEVVRRQKQFQPQPLAGKRILITRPTNDQAGLTQKLERLGATCVAFPTIDIRPRSLSTREANDLWKKLPAYEWVIFTSHHGVEALGSLAKRMGGKLSRQLRAQICSIGPRTTQAAREAGLKPDLIPQEFSTAGIQKAFSALSIQGKRLLIPRSNLGVRDPLAAFLRKKKAHVDEVVMYETKSVEHPASRMRLALHQLDAITFTSASTVEGFLKSVAKTQRPTASWINGTQLVAIGPATGQALKAGGLKEFHLPKGAWTVEGMVQTLKEVLA